MSSTIQIYNGPGSSPVCVTAMERELKKHMDERFIKIEMFSTNAYSGLEKEVAMVVIPGGNAIDMAPSIKTLAYKIKQVVGSGAAFYGSCAGAIITSNQWQNDRGQVEIYEIDNCNCNLNPFPIAMTYSMPNSKFTTDPQNRTALPVEFFPSKGHWKSTLGKISHAYGPSFSLSKIPSNVRDDTRVLAQYRSDGDHFLAEDSAATLLFSPKGAHLAPRIFTGIHPEIGPTDFHSNQFKEIYKKSCQDYFDKVISKKSDESVEASRENYMSSCNKHIDVLANTLEENIELRDRVHRSWISELNIPLKK